MYYEGKINSHTISLYNQMIYGIIFIFALEAMWKHLETFQNMDTSDVDHDRE